MQGNIKKIGGDFMKKNRVLTAVIMATIFSLSTATFSCGRPHKRDENSKKEMVSSREQALQTIKESIGEVKIKDDYAFFSSDTEIEGMVVDGEEPGTIYKVWTMNCPVEEPFLLGFCFEDDTKIVWAEKSSKDFIGRQAQIDMEYKNEQNHTAKNYDGAFAWNYSGCACAIIGLENEYACSSVWAWDTEENSISLVWYNNQLGGKGYENT